MRTECWSRTSKIATTAQHAERRPNASNFGACNDTSTNKHEKNLSNRSVNLLKQYTYIHTLQRTGERRARKDVNYRPCDRRRRNRTMATLTLDRVPTSTRSRKTSLHRPLAFYVAIRQQRQFSFETTRFYNVDRRLHKMLDAFEIARRTHLDAARRSENVANKRSDRPHRNDNTE